MRHDPAQTNPVAAARPRATHACSLLRRAMQFCRTIMILALKVTLALFVLCILIEIVSHGRVPGDALAVTVGLAAAVFTLSLIGYAVMFLVRLAVIALCFMRYSLSQMMSVILFGASCVTAIMKLPGEWKALPAMALAFLALVVLGYIIAHDPEDPWFSADFVRKTYGPKNVAPAAEVPDSASAEAEPTESDGQGRERE